MTLNNITEEVKPEATEEEVVNNDFEEVEQEGQAQEEVEEDTTEDELTDTDEIEGKEIELEDTKGKTYTDIELEEIAKSRERRIARKLEREFDKKLSKYKELEKLMRAGTNKDNLDDIISSTSEYYREEGIDIPTNDSKLSEEEIEVLAKYKADKILEFDDNEIVEEELENLASKGVSNMSKEEKVIFQTLGEYLTKQKDATELKTLGVDKEVLDSAEFKDLRSKYNGSAKEVYDLYKKIYNKDEQPKNPGAMKTKPINEGKDFYNESEAEKMMAKYTPEQLAKNPKLFDKLKKSMNSW